MAKIAAYADDNTNPAPTVHDYEATGVIGVDRANLNAVNAKVDETDAQGVDTVAEIQALVDLVAILKIDVVADANIKENTPYTSVTPVIFGDITGQLRYALAGSDATNFTIDSTAGIVSMVARDYEDPKDADKNNTYELTIIATDSDKRWAKQSWIVSITDVHEDANFTITVPDVSIQENNSSYTSTPVTGGNPIGVLTYSKGQRHATTFEVNSTTGVISMSAKDFEAPVDDNNDSKYELTVIATDSDGNTADANWTVTITDEVPTIDTYTPADGAIDVNATDINIAAVFNQDMKAQSGMIKIWQESVTPSGIHSQYKVISNVEVNGTSLSVMTIQYGHLAYGKDYFIKIDAGAFKNANNVDYAGITDDTTWNFSTSATSSPCTCPSFDNCDLPDSLQ